MNYYQQALTIHQSLVEKDTENKELQQNLSITLEKIANVYSELGDKETALYYSQQALKFNQGLTAQNEQYPLGFERLNSQL